MGSNPFHRKQVRHYHDPGDLHELTFSCYQRLPLLQDDQRCECLARCIDAAGQQTRIDLVAFVFMPEHVHLVVAPIESSPNIGHYLALVKQPFSKAVKQWLQDSKSPLIDRLTVQERPGKTCFRFWQAGAGYDRNVNTVTAIESAIDYIHLNPVRRGLTTHAIDWKWSSALWFLGSPPKQQFPGLPFVLGPPGGTFDVG